TNEPKPAAPTAAYPTISDPEILEVLSESGGNVVYRARHRKLNQPVALHLLAPDTLSRAEDRDRMRKEAATAMGLSHPGIAKLLEVGELDGRSYFSQELVEGQVLASRLDGKPQPIRPSVELVEKLAEA